MRIGGRWPTGATPPSGLPPSFAAAVAEAEAAIPEASRGGSWTLTWLEGAPVAEHDSGARVTLNTPHGDDDLFPED